MRKFVVLAAMLLSACLKMPVTEQHEDPNKEASLIAYHTVGMIADSESYDPIAAKAAQAVLADGRLTDAEYEEVIAIEDARDNEERAVAKAESLKKWTIK